MYRWISGDIPGIMVFLHTVYICIDSILPSSLHESKHSANVASLCLILQKHHLQKEHTSIGSDQCSDILHHLQCLFQEGAEVSELSLKSDTLLTLEYLQIDLSQQLLLAMP